MFPIIPPIFTVTLSVSTREYSSLVLDTSASSLPVQATTPPTIAPIFRLLLIF